MILIVSLAFWVVSLPCLADDEYDEDGRLRDSGISAIVAAHFPDTTIGTAVVFTDDVFTTPTLNLRQRVAPLPKSSWQRIVTPDYLSLGVGAENVLLSLEWELIPELLTIGGGVAYNTVENEIYGQCNFEFLEF